MKKTQVDESGNVRCPKCGANSFTQKRTAKGKMMGGVMAPKRLKCNGCGAPLKRG
jgi:DNA-directed RNA polymerase subunit RPC12/RpoP